MKGEKVENVMLGKGCFYVDDVLVGLTRDGGNFSVEYEFREINADGDRGAHKGRIENEGARAKMTINHLEILTEMEKFHPGLKVETLEGGKKRITGTGKIDDTKDYHNVEFRGETKTGKDVTIKISNAINLENINFDLKPKNEVIDTVTFQATYDDKNEDELFENWELIYG